MSYNEKDYERDVTKERDDRCVPVAKEVIKLIAAVDGLAGNVKPELLRESYDGVAKDILQLYLDKEIQISEINFVGQLVLQIVNQVTDIVNNSVNHSLKKAEVKVFGKEMREVTFKELDELLQK